MSLPPSRARFLLPNYVIGGTIALGTLGVDAVVLAYIAMHSDWTHSGGASVTALVAFLALMLPLPIGLFLSVYRQQRAVGLAGRISDHDVAHAPVSALQADREGALQAGETIAISRLLKLNIYRMFAALFLIDILFGGFIDSLLFKSHVIIPVPSSVSWEGFITTNSLMACVTLALPFILLALLPLPAILSGSWQRRLAIKADDEGISVQQSGQRDVALRWGDITSIVYTPARRAWPAPCDPFDGWYVIGNSQHFVTFNTWYGVGFALQANTALSIQFTPDIGEFLLGVERIIATIQAKQSIEMRVPARQLAHTQTLAKMWNVPDEDDDDDEILLPALIQPRADLVAEMGHSQESVILRPRLQLAKLVRNSRLGAIMSLVFFAPWWAGEALANGLFHVHDKAYFLFQTPTVGTISSLVLGGGLLLLSLWIGFTEARKERFTLIADEHGITMKKRKTLKEITVAWSAISQWGAQPRGADTPHGTRYVIVGKRNFSWDESPSDTLASPKRGMDETFQQRAEKLHAMIAAQTKLPLLHIPYEPRKLPWWKRLLL